MTTIQIAGLGAGFTTSVADGTLTITLPEPPAPPPPVGAAAVRERRLMRIGYHPTPAEFKTWFGKLPRPWFTRVFHTNGKGLPKWGGAVTALPAGTIPHVSFKDRVPAATIHAFLDSIPAPSTEVWLTWHHEGDIDWAHDIDGYTNYWTLLRQAVDDHPTRPKVTLINVHTQYASRYKRSAMDWRRFMLPGCADVDSWDCYRPANPDVYEAPEALLGLALTAQREFGVRTHITEYGTHPTTWDTDGAAQALWYRESCQVMSDAGVEAVGFWCNVDDRYEYRPTKPKVLDEWTELINTYNAVRT
jgi:hypothetical protein